MITRRCRKCHKHKPLTGSRKIDGKTLCLDCRIEHYNGLNKNVAFMDYINEKTS